MWDYEAEAPCDVCEKDTPHLIKRWSNERITFACLVCGRTTETDSEGLAI